MCLCWQQNPRQRPSFLQLLESIKDHMAPAFRTLSFFYSRGGSGEPPDTDVDQSYGKDEPSVSPPPSPKDHGSSRLPNGMA